MSISVYKAAFTLGQHVARLCNMLLWCKRGLTVSQSEVAPSVNAYEVKAGMVCLQCKKLSDLSASEVSFSRWGAIQIYVGYTFIYHYNKCVIRESLEQCVTFDEERKLVRDDWLDEVVEVAHIDAGVLLRARSDV